MNYDILLNNQEKLYNKGTTMKNKCLQAPNVIISKPVHTITRVADWNDALMKAYYAGLLTAHSKILLYGIGSKGGTNWAIGTVMETIEPCFLDSYRAFRFFTNIYNQQKRNYGHTINKKSFALTQFEEVTSVAKYFGIESILDTLCDEIYLHDEKWDLRSEVIARNNIHDYSERTILKTIVLKDYELDIMEASINKIMTEEACKQAITSDHIPNAVELLSNAFIEGTRGWTLGSADLNVLRHSGSLPSQYDNVAA